MINITARWGFLCASGLAFLVTAPGALSAELGARRAQVCGARIEDHRNSANNFTSENRAPFPAKVRILAEPRDALITRLQAIRGARSSILLSTYIFKPDESGLAVLDELRKAIARGVNVSLMVDAGGSVTERRRFSGTHLKTLFNVKAGINPKSGVEATVDIIEFLPLDAVNFANRFVEEARRMDRTQMTSLNLNRRSHDKILLVDADELGRSLAIVGGRNISNDYFGVPTVDDHTYEDMEVLVQDVFEEPASQRLSSTLGEHFWNLACAKGNSWLGPIPPLFNGALNKAKKVEGSSDRLMALLGIDPARIGSPPSGGGGHHAWIDVGNEIHNIKRLSVDVFRDPDEDPADRESNGDSIRNQFVQLVQKAEHTIDLVSPYLYLTKSERAYLREWVRADSRRRLRIITNSVATSDNMMAQIMVDNLLAPDLMSDTLGGRIAVYELGKLNNSRFENQRKIGSLSIGGKGLYGKLHSKYAIIDNKIALVTSSNGDPRSRLLNSEVGIFIWSEDAMLELRKDFNSLMVRSYLWGSDRWQIMVGESLEQFGLKRYQIQLFKPVLMKFPRLRSFI